MNLKTHPDPSYLKIEVSDFYGQTVRDIQIDGTKKQINEVWIKEEVYEFKIKEDSKTVKKFEPEIESILKQEAKIEGELTDVLGFNLETYFIAGNAMKGVSRVVLINEHGQRVFDTQIKLLNDLPETNGKKQLKFLREQAQAIAPDIEDVRQMVLQLTKGRKIIGYLLKQDFKEFQIESLVGNQILPNGQDQLFDCCYQFKDDTNSQISMDKLCGQYLNLKYQKKKNSPSTFSEAKITMALYHKWKKLYGEGSIIPGPNPLSKGNCFSTNVHCLQLPSSQVQKNSDGYICLNSNNSRQKNDLEQNCKKLEKTPVKMVEMSGSELLQIIETQVQAKIKQKLNQLILQL